MKGNQMTLAAEMAPAEGSPGEEYLTLVSRAQGAGYWRMGLKFVINRSHNGLIKGYCNLHTLALDQSHNESRKGQFGRLMCQTT